MFASSDASPLWVVGGVIVAVALWWLAKKIDPHWVAKDGRAFTCKVQPLGDTVTGEGRWREARASVEGDSVRLVVRGLGVPVQPFQSHAVLGRSESPPAGQAIYLVGATNGFALRIPRKSRAVEVLDELVAKRG
jgi:hypothetical protein